MSDMAAENDDYTLLSHMLKPGFTRQAVAFQALPVRGSISARASRVHLLFQPISIVDQLMP